MKKILFTLLVTLSPSLALGEPPASTPIKVGLILPLTGPLAEYGNAFRNGIEMAQGGSDQISKNCSFKVEDSQYDSKVAVAAFEKLSTVDDVSVMYNWGGPTSEAIAPLTDRRDVALFVWSSDPRVSEGRQKVIRFANSGADYGGALAHYLAGQGYHTIGIVKTENQYIESILQGLESADEKLQIEVIDSFQPSSQDFRSTITKIKGKKYDTLGLFLLSGQVSQFARQLRSQAVALPLFGTDFFESMTEVGQSYGAMVDSVFANNEVLPRFREDYENRFHNDFQINHAANGYDFATFLCATSGVYQNKLSASQIIKIATTTASFVGMQGKAVYTTSNAGDKYFKFPVVIRKIEADKIVTVGLKS